LHRNELPEKIEEQNYQLPCVIVETEEKMIEIFNKLSFQDSNTSLNFNSELIFSLILEFNFL